MEEMEKKNIYVPSSTKESLLRDARNFEIFRKDRNEVNTNMLLSNILLGYYENYSKMLEEKRKLVYEHLKDIPMKDESKNEIVNSIVSSVISPLRDKGKNEKMVSMSLKPTKATRAIISHINDNELRNESISKYFCKMLMSYCAKPIYERERIVFSDNCERINEAIESKRCLSFSTIWNSDRHNVVPYGLVVGRDEMFNYLLCAEISKDDGSYSARTYRLNRINDLTYYSSGYYIDEKIRSYLERMKSDAAYAINDDEETCVRLTEIGKKNYNRIYFGRPNVERIDGDLYYFRCSRTQLEFYFRRFGKDAVVLKPKQIKDDITEFFKEAYLTYNTEEE